MGDPFWNKTVLLTGFEDGGDGTTVVSDESQFAHGAATALGSAQIDTAQAKSGASSGLFGAGAAFQWADAPDFHFGAGKFTIEGFFRFNVLTDPAFLLNQWITGGDLEWVLLWNAGNLEWTTSEDGAGFFTDISTPWSPSLATWYHVALDYDLVKYRAYVAGVMLGSFAGPARNLFVSSGGLQVSSAVASRNIDGWADELRITKGAARYATDTSFTVPSVPFPRVGNPVPIGGGAALIGL